MKNRKCAITIFFDIRGYFEISVVEITRIKKIVQKVINTYSFTCFEPLY